LKIAENCRGAKGLEAEELKILLVLMDWCKSTLGRMVVDMIANGGENNRDRIFKFERYGLKRATWSKGVGVVGFVF
jgi:hypothetical protein